MTGLIFVLFLLTVVLCVFGTSIIFCRCRHRQFHQPEETDAKHHKVDEIKDQSYMSAVFVANQPSVNDAKGPDIITNTCGKLTV